MKTLIPIAYLLGTFLLGYLYYWSAIFKEMGMKATIDDVNEDLEEGEEPATEGEVNALKNVFNVIFLIVGFICWLYIGITVGRIAPMITGHFILKWIVYVLMYFIFVRFPFGVLNRMIKKTYELERFPEKILFSMTMIGSYILSICCYEKLPKLFNWFLMYLD